MAGGPGALSRRCGGPARELAQILDGVHAEVATRSIKPWSTSTVAWASVSARWFGATVAWCPANVATIGYLITKQDLAGQGRRVDHRPARERVLTRVTGAAQEADIERSVVRNDHGAVSERKERRQYLAQGRALTTIWLVMPVSTAIRGGMWAFGLTRVWNSPRTSPPRTLTAPTSVIMSVSAPPVVQVNDAGTSPRTDGPKIIKEACSATMATLGSPPTVTNDSPTLSRVLVAYLV